MDIEGAGNGLFRKVAQIREYGNMESLCARHTCSHSNIVVEVDKVEYFAFVRDLSLTFFSISHLKGRPSSR